MPKGRFANPARLVGLRFGGLIVAGFAGVVSNRSMWRCICDCGQEKIISGTHLSRSINPVRSCGCCAGNMLHGHSTSNGGLATPTYNSWKGMMARCYCMGHVSFSSYGGRGITVDPRWHNFATFLEDMGEKPRGLTLERKDSSKSYSQDNCIWASWERQARNKSNVRQVSAFGMQGCLRDIADAFGVKYSSFVARLNRTKETPEEAIRGLLLQ